MELPSRILALLDDFAAETGARIADVSDRIESNKFSINVGAVILTHFQGDLDETKKTLGAKLNEVDWFSSEMKRGGSLVLLAPMLFVDAVESFHATRLANVESIFEWGLLPSIPERCNTDRPDCYANIYVCPTLGNLPPDPTIEPAKETAHWWRWYLSKHNRYDDPDWSILQVDLANSHAKVYRDTRSTSGLIVNGLEAISPERLKLIWPAR